MFGLTSIFEVQGMYQVGRIFPIGRNHAAKPRSCWQVTVGGLHPKRNPHFPMQKVLKIKFRMSSVVVAPVTSSSGRSAL